MSAQTKYARYEELKERVTPGVKLHRSVELFVADLIAFGLTSQRFILALLVLLCASTATFTRHHIAMRSMQTQLDHTLSHFPQFIANCMLFFYLHGHSETWLMAMAVSYQVKRKRCI